MMLTESQVADVQATAAAGGRVVVVYRRRTDVPVLLGLLARPGDAVRRGHGRERIEPSTGGHIAFSSSSTGSLRGRYADLVATCRGADVDSLDVVAMTCTCAGRVHAYT